MDKKVLSTAELAERWGLSPQTLRNWRCQDKGPSYFRAGGPGSRVKYPLDEIERIEREEPRDGKLKPNIEEEKTNGGN